jgi:hypothetical protein
MLAEGKNIETTTGEIPPVTEETPHFRNITIRNLTCRGALQAIYLQGLPELNLENVTLENIDIQAESGIVCIDASKIKIKNIHLTVGTMPLVRILNSSSVDIQGLKVNEINETIFEVAGDKSREIRIEFVKPDGTTHVKTIE